MTRLPGKYVFAESYRHPSLPLPCSDRRVSSQLIKRTDQLFGRSGRCQLWYGFPVPSGWTQNWPFNLGWTAHAEWPRHGPHWPRHRGHVQDGPAVKRGHQERGNDACSWSPAELESPVGQSCQNRSCREQQLCPVQHVQWVKLVVLSLQRCRPLLPVAPYFTPYPLIAINE